MAVADPELDPEPDLERGSVVVVDDVGAGLFGSGWSGPPTQAAAAKETAAKAKSARTERDIGDMSPCPEEPPKPGESHIFARTQLCVDPGPLLAGPAARKTRLSFSRNKPPRLRWSTW